MENTSEEYKEDDIFFGELYSEDAINILNGEYAVREDEAERIMSIYVPLTRYDEDNPDYDY